MGRKIGTFGLVNYKQHPRDKDYMVLSYNSKEEADFFIGLMEKSDLWYEAEEDEVNKEAIYLFAVRDRDFSKVQKLNYEVSAKFKPLLIKNKVLRYAVLGFFFAIVTLSIVGYVKNTKLYKPDKVENSTE